MMTEDCDDPASPEIILLEEEDINTETNNDGKMRCIFTWCIKNFSSCQLDCGEELCSPIFSADSSAKTKWYVSVFPNGQTDYGDFVSVHLIRLSIENELGNTKLYCKFSIMDSESEVWHSEKSEYDLGSSARFAFDAFVSKIKLVEDKVRVLPEDTLTVSCQICAYDENVIDICTEASNEAENNQTLLRSFSKDLKTLLRSGEFSDITLKMSDGSISAHRVILGARSSTFAEFCNLPDSEILIPDFEKSTMQGLLSYIYSGEIDTVSSASSLQLYEAAEKYKVRELMRSITPSKIFARTEVIKEQFSFTWRLKNFRHVNRNSGRMIYSDRFHTGPTGRLWSLSLYFHNRSAADDDEDIGVYLNKLWTNDEKKAVYVQFEVSLLDKDEEPLFTVRKEKCYNQATRFGCSSFIKRNTLLREMKDLLPGDTLTIRCDMKVCDGTALSTIQHSHSSTNTNLLEISDLKDLSECFKDLFFSNLYTDVTVVCSSKKKFLLHRAILCARSPEFADFFQRNACDLRPYTIDLKTGITPRILNLLFLFIYTGELEDLSCETAPDLYAAANFYKISNIKGICSNFLKSNLATSNAFKLMVLSKTLDDAELKGLVKDFICSHAEELIKSSQWQDFVKDHQDMSTEILQSLTDGYRESKRRRLD